MDEQDKTLLEELKNYLDIPWEDEQGDKKLYGIVKRGMSQLSGRIGECNFYEETQEKALLFDYVMYARAADLPQFWMNYKAEILTLQIARKVDEYATEEE